MATPFSADTSAAAAAVQVRAWRAMSPAERLAQARALTALVLRLEQEGLRQRNPTLSPAELHRAAVARRLGPTLVAKAYPPAGRER